MEGLHLVGPRAAALLDQLVADGGADAAPVAKPGGRAVVWVRVTGGAAPWWTGPVEVPITDGSSAATTWQTLGDGEVTSIAGPLKSGKRYLAVRTGDKADGTPRFVAVMVPVVARTVVTAVDLETCSVTTDTGYLIDA